MSKIFIGDFFVNIKDKKDLLNKVKFSIEHGKKPSIFYYLNVASYYEQSNNHDFKEIFNRADYSYLNSSYIKKIIRSGIEKLNAEDFLYDIFKLCQKNKLKVFLLGAKQKTLQKALLNIKKKYSDLTINGFNGYFKNSQKTLNTINNSKPDILVVGLGFGYQEKWINKNLNNISKVKVILTIGNFIDVLGEERKLSATWTKKLQLEWLFRLIYEPKRLWKRYILGGICFTYISIKYLLSFDSRNNVVGKSKTGS